MKKKFATAILALSLLLTQSGALALAADHVIFPEASKNTVSVTPENLETFLFAGSTDIARSMNNVQRAKNQVEVARGDLIPSLNLNLIAVITNPPMFMVSSVSCLVPFLFPSKWYEFSAAKKTAVAEAAGLEITKLNAYAAAYTLLSRFAGDETVYRLMNEQYLHLERYVAGLQAQYELGLISQADIHLSDLELSRMRGELARLSENMDVQRAALRKMLGFSLDQKFNVAFSEEGASRIEDSAATQATLLQVYDRAPERRQLELLYEAADSHVSASSWAFLAGCSGSQGNFGPTDSGQAFTQSTSVGIGIGYGFFPKVSLAKRSRDEIVIRQKEMVLELGRVLESTQKSIQSLKTRMNESVRGLQIAERLLTEQTQLAELGKASVKNVLDAFSAVARAKIELAASKTALEGHRITLKRTALEGRFLKVLIKARKEFEPSTSNGRKGS